MFNQGFETDTAGWFDNSDYAGYGEINRVASGTGGIASASGGYHAQFSQLSSGSFTRFDGYRDSWSGPYQASVAIYLDTSWGIGEGFDYSVASNGSNNAHLRDFIFHIGVQNDGQLMVGGSNNTNFDPRMDLGSINSVAISTSGWYTFEHSFFEMGDGSLGVALNLYDSSGTLIFTELRNTPSDLIASNVGGNRYGWFTNIDIAGGINVDDVTLNVVPLPPAALAGLGLLGAMGVRRKLRSR